MASTTPPRAHRTPCAMFVQIAKVKSITFVNKVKSINVEKHTRSCSRLTSSVAMSAAKPKLCRYGFLTTGGAKQSEATDFRCNSYSPAPEETPAAKEAWAALISNFDALSEAKVKLRPVPSSHLARAHTLIHAHRRNLSCCWLTRDCDTRAGRGRGACWCACGAPGGCVGQVAKDFSPSANGQIHLRF
jgi:hypothetical protein